MEEIVYLSIRLGCTAYLLYKVWEQKKRIGKICDLLYTPRKKTETEKDYRRNPESAADVMGATRFVYLDENAGKTVAPYMSQQLEMGSDLIGKDEDIPEDEVECKLPLEEMRMLKDEHCRPTTPSAVRLNCFWNLFTVSVILLPKIPSTVSRPRKG